MLTLPQYLSDINEHSLVPMFSKYVVSASFYVILALIVATLLTWPWQGFVTFMQEQRVPYTFMVVMMVLLAAQTYLHLRLGRGEIGIQSYFTREKIHQQYLPTEIAAPFLSYGFPRACLQILMMLAPVLPILLLATVVSGYAMLTLLKALSVIAAASLVCRLWGFLVYELWGNNSILGYFMVRVFLAGAIYLSAFLAIPLSPLRVLYRLDLGADLSQNPLFQPYTVYMLTAFGSIVVLTLGCEWLARYRRRKAISVTSEK